MDNKKMNIIIMTLLVLSIILNIILLFVLKQRGAIAGFATLSPEQPLAGNDIIEINRQDMSLCCSFINEQGEEDGCYVLNEYDCSYCSDYCSE